MSDSAYIAAVRMLATRELSEAQIRRRLARKGFDESDIDAAVTRLKADRSLDDERTAGAIARTEVNVRRRGRLRVRRQIEAAGIASSIAERVTSEVFSDVDADALLAAALERRLHGRTVVDDDRERSRLYRYLLGQGFEHDRIVAALRQRR